MTTPTTGFFMLTPLQKILKREYYQFRRQMAQPVTVFLSENQAGNGVFRGFLGLVNLNENGNGGGGSEFGIIYLEIAVRMLKADR
jgi:hypothetical protein